MNNKIDFSGNPTKLDISRSKFNRPYNTKLTYNTGHLVPIYVDEVLPGDTVNMKMSEICRMQTPIFPVMDNAYIDTYFFFVPNRIIWEHWEEFMGENKTGIWEQETEYEIPTIKFNTDMTPVEGGAPAFLKKAEKWYKTSPQAGSLADYLGMPINDADKNRGPKGEYEVNALPFRAYYQIYNDWFRDENLMYPIEFDKGDATVIADISGDDPEEYLCVFAPKYGAKFHDYFTSALPQPQKSDDILLPLGNDAPIVGNGKGITFTNGSETYYNGNSNIMGGNPMWIGLTKTGSANNEVGEMIQGSWTSGGTDKQVLGFGEETGLKVDLSSATAATINALRQAFQVQKFYEQEARGGSRYIEIIKSMFGVTSADGRMQRAEYLGGCRQALNINQVIQQSGTDNGGTLTQQIANAEGDPMVFKLDKGGTPQGNVSAYSLTTMSDGLFTKSFTEHGILMGIQIIRTEHSYQNGLNKIWSKRNKFDFYFPVFANIGEQAILNKEIFLNGKPEEGEADTDNEAFGYQEAWAEYRYKPNEVHGEFRSNYAQSLDSWHWADNYVGLPYLSQAWLEELEVNVNRTIAVTDAAADQFMADIWFDSTWTRAMPVYSVPGLIDHH